ncbi:MAG: protein kinase [Planctomycetaceae bacterium]
MTTEARTVCLTAESLERLAEGAFQAVELAQLEEHIGACEHCRSMLESASLDAQWNDELLPVLRTPVEGRGLDSELKGLHPDEHSLESVLKLLGPTDDPDKLGRIGTYEVIGIIGRGGMGVVFKAFDAALNRFVAIKMLLPHLAISGAARKRFAREGQAAAAVIDDNVLPIFSVAEWQGVPYLVTQYSRGMTLQKRVQDQGSLELKEILRIGMQTARGLAAAHTQGLVHRDVKPSNILLDGTVERALLTDFGLARAVDDASVTRTGVIAGTPQYMSPEQARGDSVDARSDLFGLGCVLYTMCTGRPPFRAENSYAVLRLITDAEPRPIQGINPEIPDWLCQMIARLMAKSPNDRFGSAAEVAEVLEQCLAHVQQPMTSPLPEQLRMASTASKPRRTRRWMTAVGALLLGLISLFGFVISFQSNDGTLLIESSVDDVTVRVSQGDTVVRQVSVTKAGTKLKVTAGSYLVTVDGNVDGIAIENDNVNLRRGGTEVVKLTYQRAATAATPSGDTPNGKSPNVDQQLSNIEKSVYVTNVRSDGQVLYFTLNQRNAPKGVAAFLEVQFHCEKPMPFVWTGPGPDAATVVRPTHTVTWNGSGKQPIQLGIPIDRLIPLPIAANEHKVAFIFPDKDSAVVAAKQLAAIGDQSLLDAQRRANSIEGRLRDDGIIFGDHPAIGRFTTHFRVLMQTSAPPDLGLAGTPRPAAARDLVGPPNVQMALAFPTINWRQLYIGRAGEPQLAKSHQITEEQLQRILEITQTFLREATPATREAEEKRAQSAVQALLTVDQDRLLRREIWVAINATRLRVPTTHKQLGLNSDQRKQIDEIWNKFVEEVRQNRGMRADGSDSYEQIFDDTFEVLTPEQRRLYFFKLQDPVFHSGIQPIPFGVDLNRDDLVLPEKEPLRLVDVLNLHLRRERGRFPLLDWVIEDVRLYERGALEAFDRAVREDREQYAKDHPELAKAFETWQTEFRDVRRATEIIPKLFEEKATRQVMVTVARLLIRSGDVPGITKEKLDQAYQELGEYPSDKRVEKVFIGLINARHSTRQQQSDESVPDVPHTKTHETHLKNAETAKAHYDFARLYCAIEQSEMFRQIRKVLESADPATEFLFEESHALPNDKVLSFVSRRGHEEVRSRERAYHAIPQDSVIVKWKFGDQEMSLTNRDSHVITHVIVDRRMDGHVVWKCYGIPKEADVTAPMTWFRPDPFPQLGSYGVTGNTLCRMAMELASYEPAQRELALTAEQQKQIKEVDVAAIPFNENGGLTQQSSEARDRIVQILQPEQRTRLDQLLLQRLGLFAFEMDGIRETLELSKEQQQRIQETWKDHARRVKDLDVALNDQHLAAQTGKIDAAHLKSSITDHQQQMTSLQVHAWDDVYSILNVAQRQKFETLRGSQVKSPEAEREGALNLRDLQREDSKIRATNRQLRDPNAVLLSALQGTWLMTAIVAPDGTVAKVSNPAETGHSIHFKNSTVVLKQGLDDEDVPLKFTLDASTPTPEIDIEGLEGLYMLGLIEIKNGTLHLRLGAGGDDRPSETVKPSIHYQYRRQPEARP